MIRASMVEYIEAGGDDILVDPRKRRQERIQKVLKSI